MAQTPAPALGTKAPSKIGSLAIGDHAVIFAVVRSAEVKHARNGDFLVLSLADSTGQVIGKKWDTNAVPPTITAGTVVKVGGEIEEYAGALNIIILQMRPAKPDEYSLADLVPATARDVVQMREKLQATAVNITDPALCALVSAFFLDDEFMARYVQAPCSENFNHAYLGGLMEHTVEMVTLAEVMLTMYPAANADLVRAGILLANIGKVESYIALPFIGETPAHREQGHILIGYGMVVKAIANLEAAGATFDGAAAPLLHILAAQSGRLEWGSPVSPKTVEAAIVHGAESLSAKASALVSHSKK